MKVWQIATGERSRNYSELFSAHDLMLVGPGDLGDARCGGFGDGISNSNEVSRVRRFAHEVNFGDRVLMRSGQEVIGIGEIPSESEHQYAFDCTFRSVYGWDLRHRRRVKWAAEPKLGSLATAFEGKHIRDRFTRVHNPEIVAAVRDFDAACFTAPLNEVPSIEANTYTEDELRDELFRTGVSDENTEAILTTLSRASELIRWYRSGEAGRDPREYEVVSHIVLPLFLGLGWPYERIAVEWRRADMAFFKRTPTTPENCVMVLEAKGLKQGLSEVLRQPENYVRTQGLEGVRYIVTTNGANLFVYEQSESDWGPTPVGYLDITSLQKEYVLPRKTKLVNTLRLLQANEI